MNKKVYTVIIGTGSYIPSRIISNDFFLDAEFYDPATNKGLKPQIRKSSVNLTKSRISKSEDTLKMTR